MKRVICLYRVSTVGQVDHDDIPMQKIACREYAANHADWEIIDEISEKGVSGYKVSANDRDAIVTLKQKATRHEFDVLLVFMFDRLGRREDETPFVVQWFVQNGIEVWSTREGEQRFDNHVDKLLNYIRYWQASGESEKTSVRIKTKHYQMVQEGQYRGGYVAFGYRLENLGRTNKKNKPVPDIVIDEAEASIVREIFHLITDEGYGTNRVANWLNDRGIKTKRGTDLWRGTSVRALISNQMYIGKMKFSDSYSPPLEKFRILDDETFFRCNDIVKQRAPKYDGHRQVPHQTDERTLLTGFIYCKHCGSRLSFNRNVKTKKYYGITRTFEHHLYRCLRKISAKNSCDGPYSYHCEPINDEVLDEMWKFFNRVKAQPKEELINSACNRKISVLKKAYDDASKQMEEAKKQVDVLEEQAMLTLTGQEGGLSIDMINSMLPRYKEKMEKAQQQMTQAKIEMEAEEAVRDSEVAQYNRLMDWAEKFEDASTEAKHMILSQLIDRVEVGKGYDITIKFNMTAQEYLNPSLEETSQAG